VQTLSLVTNAAYLPRPHFAVGSGSLRPNGSTDGEKAIFYKQRTYLLLRDMVARSAGK